MDPLGLVLTVAVVAFFAGAAAAVVRRSLGYAVALAASILLLVAAVGALAYGPVHAAPCTGP